MNTPIKGVDFEDYMNQMEVVCLGIESNICYYMKNAVLLQLPEENAVNKKDYDSSVKNVYQNVNGKTPKDLVKIYKNILTNNLNISRARDLQVEQNLDSLFENYEATKQYAKDIIVSKVNVEFTKNNQMLLSFLITNKSPFVIKQFITEAEFYSPSDIYLGRVKAFPVGIHNFLAPDNSTEIRKYVPQIKEEDMTLIRASKTLRIKVNIPSVTVIDGVQKDTSKVVVLSLPYSYFRMRELLDESKNLYNDTLNKINEIDIK